MQKKNVTLVGFGDSITQAVVQMPDENMRWLNILKTRLAAAFPACDFTVINSGIGGNSTREAMARFEKDVLAHDPDWVLLEFGGNNDDPNNPPRRVAVDEFRQHLRNFKQGLAAKTKVIVITFPPVIDEQHSYFGSAWCEELGGHDAAVERFREITRQFAKDNGYPLVDLSQQIKQRMTPADKNQYILRDGVHLTQMGNQLLAELVFEVLQKALR